MNRSKFYWENPSIRVDDLIEEIRKNTWGKSYTVPNGWVRPKDIVEIMKNINRRTNNE